MAKNKKILRSAVALCLLACMLVSLAACAKQQPDETGATGDEKASYTIEIKNRGGTPLAEVGVYIYADSTQEELVWFAKTDEAGRITFTDLASDSYVAVLKDAPEGYQAEETYPLTGETTQIVLEAIAVEDPTSIIYHLGDMMQDFTVTAADGTEYTLSELLAEKAAVVLNFWYGECAPCRMEFPYLQEAYALFSDRIAVLALNPVDTDDETISQIQSELGLTFPMVQCDKAWASAMQVTGYPTTVVIDRYGTISLIHRGSVPEARLFLNIFAYYADEQYQPGVVEDAQSLPDYEGTPDPTEPDATEPSVDPGTEPTEPAVKPTDPTTKPTDPTTKPTEPPTEPPETKPTLDTKENEVIDIDIGSRSFDVTVQPWKVVYCNLYRIPDTIVTINDPDVTIIYNGKTYDASNGAVSLTIKAADFYSPVKIGIGNRSNGEKTFRVTLSNPPGSWDNPYSMSLGEFTVKTAAGDEDGVFYDFVATQTGTLTLQCLSVSPSVDFVFMLYNLDSCVMHNLESDGEQAASGAATVSIPVTKGQKVRFNVGTLPDDSNQTQSSTFKFLAAFEPG